MEYLPFAPFRAPDFHLVKSLILLKIRVHTIFYTNSESVATIWNNIRRQVLNCTFGCAAAIKLRTRFWEKHKISVIYDAKNSKSVEITIWMMVN